MKNRTVLITGGTGSFGAAMVQHLLKQGCTEIRILSRDECKQHEMRRRFANPTLKFYLGDVRSRASVDGAMRGADMVFHAAALKQVPSCEFFPMQAVQTNVNGSNNVIESAISHCVSSVVCLSTDKSVFPVNAMGMSKALMEKNVCAIARRLGPDHPTKLCVVRYGNVMHTRGSVIPLFVNLIKEDKPLTITDPRMTRFMIPMYDVVNLVQTALTTARQGDLFVPGAPAATMEVLARAICNIMGRNPGIKQIGVRPGEKIHETLASAAELLRAEKSDDYYRIPLDDRDLDHPGGFAGDQPDPAQTENYESSNTRQLTVGETEELLMTLEEIQCLSGRLGGDSV